MSPSLVLAALAPLLQLTGPASDTLVVTANNAPVWGDAPTLVEELRIGSIEGDPAYAFGRVTGVVEGADGTIWVADGLGAVIRRFRPDGTHLDDVGRKGEGPGEFTGGMDIALKPLPDGRIVAFDVAGRRISLFAADGTYLGGWPAPIGCITTVSPSLVVTDSSRLILRSCSRRTDLWVVADAEGAAVDTLVVPPADVAAPAARILPFGTMSPYIAKTVSVPSPKGHLAVARTDDFALHWPLADGRIVRVERDWAPVRVRPEEREQFRAVYVDRARMFTERGIATDRPFDDIPSTKPAFWAFQVDDDGRFWVARHQEGYFAEETDAERRIRLDPDELPNTPMEWREELRVDVIEPSGRFLGSVLFPAFHSTIASASGDRLWVVEEGDFGEQYVVRYRVARAGSRP